MHQELWKYSILEIVKGYKQRKFSPLELAKEIIKKIGILFSKRNLPKGVNVLFYSLSF